MEYIDRNIELDFNAGQAVQPTTIKLNTDNRGSVRFSIRIIDGNKEISYSSFQTVGIVIHKYDGNNVTADSDLNPDKLKIVATGITYILHDEALTRPGTLTMQVDLYPQSVTETIEDGAKKFSTLFFSFQVVASALRTRTLGAASGTYLGQLEELIAVGSVKYDKLMAYLEELEEYLAVLKTQGQTEYETFEEFLEELKEQGLLTVEEIKLLLADVQAGAFVTIDDFNTAVSGITDYLEEVTTFGLDNDTVVRYGQYAMGNVLNAAPNDTIAIGRYALQNVTGVGNIAIGRQAAAGLAEGKGNIAAGILAMGFNATGSLNIAIGSSTLGRAKAPAHCVAIGNTALYGPATIVNSVGIGNYAGGFLADGSSMQTIVKDSVFLGCNTKGSSSNDQPNQIVIGYNAQGHGSNTAHIGNSDIASISYGAATGTAFTNRSDPRIKEYIHDADLEICVDNVKSLPLHRFKYKGFVGNEGDQHVLGFMSTEFKEILPKAVHRNTMTFDKRDENGDIIYETRLIDELVDEEVEVFDPDTGETRTELQPALRQVEKEVPKQIVIEDCESIDSSQLTPILWGAVQKLIARVEELEAKINV